MVDSARTRTLVWLNTYLRAAQMTRDDNITQLAVLVSYANPPYPLKYVFYDPKNMDVVFSLGKPNSASQIDSDHYIYGYDEVVPITIQTLDKTGITAEKALEKCEAELRWVQENYPLGSLRYVPNMKGKELRTGGLILLGTEFELNYKRDTT